MRNTTPTLIAGRYEVGELLGRGGMAEVYAGIDRRLSRPVAIKLLQESMAAREDVRVRFEAEARAAAAISQPHAVAVYDSGEHEGVPFIVMERLPGDTLADRIAVGPVLSAAEARAYGRQVLGALEAAHGVGMVHRDVKPGNILLTREGQAKIADFGIAKSLDVSADLTGTGQLIGTPAYLAPEQLGGDPASAVTDIYALGVVLYEALTGRKPFGGDSAMTTARAVVQGDHEPLASVRPDLDHDLVRAVERALEPDPAARFQSATAMSVALAPPAVATVVPTGIGGMAGGPDGTQVLDAAEIAAQTMPATAASGVAADTTHVDAPSAASGLGASDVGASDVGPSDVGASDVGASDVGASLRPAPAAPRPPPSSPEPPLAARRQPSRNVRIGLVALVGLVVLFLLFQVLRPDGDTAVTEAGAPTASSTVAPSTVAPTTVPPTTAAPSAAASLAAELRTGASRLGPGDGVAAPGLAVRMKVVADQVERGDPAATTTATALIIDVAIWRQAGQLGDAATVTAVQLLQKVQVAAVGGSAPAIAATGPADVVPDGDQPKGKDKDDKGNGRDNDD